MGSSQLDNILGDLDYLGPDYNGASDYEPKSYEYDYQQAVDLPPQVVAQRADGTSDVNDVPKTEPAISQGNQAHSSSSMLPAYCDPPNPCPLGYTAADGCIEDFENTSELVGDTSLIKNVFAIRNICLIALKKTLTEGKTTLLLLTSWLEFPELTYRQVVTEIHTWRVKNYPWLQKRGCFKPTYHQKKYVFSKNNQATFNYFQFQYLKNQVTSLFGKIINFSLRLRFHFSPVYIIIISKNSFITTYNMT